MYHGHKNSPLSPNHHTLLLGRLQSVRSRSSYVLTGRKLCSFRWWLPRDPPVELKMEGIEMECSNQWKIGCEEWWHIVRHIEIWRFVIILDFVQILIYWCLSWVCNSVRKLWCICQGPVATAENLPIAGCPKKLNLDLVENCVANLVEIIFWVVVSTGFYFHPYFWEDSHWLIFSEGLKPRTLSWKWAKKAQPIHNCNFLARIFNVLNQDQQAPHIYFPSLLFNVENWSTVGALF